MLDILLSDAELPTSSDMPLLTEVDTNSLLMISLEDYDNYDRIGNFLIERVSRTRLNLPVGILQQGSAGLGDGVFATGSQPSAGVVLDGIRALQVVDDQVLAVHFQPRVLFFKNYKHRQIRSCRPLHYKQSRGWIDK